MKLPLRIRAFHLPTLCVLPVLPVILASAALPRPTSPERALVRSAAEVSSRRAVVPLAATNSHKWKVVTDRKGFCQISVPDDWELVLPGMAIPPGGGTHASVSASPGGSLSAFKGIASMAFKPTAITEDTPKRYAFSYGTSGLHRYAARAFPGLVCAVEVDVSATEKAAAMADDVQKIVVSLDRVPKGMGPSGRPK